MEPPWRKSSGQMTYPCSILPCIPSYYHVRPINAHVSSLNHNLLIHKINIFDIVQCRNSPIDIPTCSKRWKSPSSASRSLKKSSFGSLYWVIIITNMYMYIYIYVYIYMYIQYIYIYMYQCIHSIYMYMYLCVYIQCLYICIYTYIYTCIYYKQQTDTQLWNKCPRLWRRHPGWKSVDTMCRRWILIPLRWNISDSVAS